MIAIAVTSRSCLTSCNQQPGDWICKKCNYLNWRRRKVCQTCLPCAYTLRRPALTSINQVLADAEGNGDSISAPIQAERIALLTSVLAQTQLSDGNTGNASPLPVIRSHSSTPPNTRHPRRPTDTSGLLPNSVHRSHSQLELTAQYTSHINSLPIYQTSGHRQPSPLYSTGPEFNQGHQVHAPAPLLPSFLQDMVQSPTLSPSSSSSADLSSLEEDTNLVQDVPGEKRQGASPVNIWRLGIEESKSYNVFALQNRQNIVTAPRNSNVPMLR